MKNARSPSPERLRGGPFRDYEEIGLRVHGIGPFTVERLSGAADLLAADLLIALPVRLEQPEYFE